MGGWGERGRLEATIRNLGRPAKQSPPSLPPSFLPSPPSPPLVETHRRREHASRAADSTSRERFFRIRTRRVCSFLFLPSCFLSFFRDRTLVQERINAVLENNDERYVAPFKISDHPFAWIGSSIQFWQFL